MKTQAGAHPGIWRCPHPYWGARMDEILQYLKILCASRLLKCPCPDYKSVHFSGSLFSLAFTWEGMRVSPCTDTSVHPSLPRKILQLLWWEIARAWSKGSCWIKELRRSDVRPAPTPRLIIIPLWCIFIRTLFPKTISSHTENSILADKPETFSVVDSAASPTGTIPWYLFPLTTRTYTSHRGVVWIQFLQVLYDKSHFDIHPNLVSLGHSTEMIKTNDRAWVDEPFLHVCQL